uniref:Uncharacterized protein n=1 Tax=Parascaris univalens TaxID=6257 RepID=A0A915AC76_PARUN
EQLSSVEDTAQMFRSRVEKVSHLKTTVILLLLSQIEYVPIKALKCMSGFEEGSLFRSEPRFYTRNCENGFDFCYKEYREEGYI